MVITFVIHICILYLKKDTSEHTLKLSTNSNGQKRGIPWMHAALHIWLMYTDWLTKWYYVMNGNTCHKLSAPSFVGQGFWYFVSIERRLIVQTSQQNSIAISISMHQSQAVGIHLNKLTLRFSKYTIVHIVQMIALLCWNCSLNSI